MLRKELKYRKSTVYANYLPVPFDSFIAIVNNKLTNVGLMAVICLTSSQFSK